MALKIGKGALAPPFLVMDIIAAANARQALLPAEQFSQLYELVFCLARDVAEDRRGKRPQVGQVMGDEVLDAVVVEANGVEHAGRRLDSPRGWVAGARVSSYRLGDYAAQA